jgi:signal transduction histidine kinase
VSHKPALPDQAAPNELKRQETDESLRVERDKADVALIERRSESEEKTDEIVQVARDRADEVVRTARDVADRQAAAAPSSSGVEAISRRQRNREDSVLEDERARADAVLERERAERKRYLAEFLAVERDATDDKLTDERAHADDALSARDEFLAAVSHDLRTLLAGLVLNADLLVTLAPAGDTGIAIRKHARLGRRLTAQMNRLVNDLLDVVSIDAGTLAIIPERVAVEKLLQDAADAFGPIAAAAGVTLDVELPAVSLYARIDDGRIAQVIANLISNAIKFVPAGGTVSMRAQRASNEIVVCVSDTGIGIPKDNLETVFERLRQVRRDRRGLGLGLYISKSLIEAHGGRIWVESEVAKGSSFYFAVPADPSAPRDA